MENLNARKFKSVSDFYESYKRSITSEISYLSTVGGKKQRVFDGRQIEIKDGRYVYTFETDNKLSYPKGTQISICKEQTSISGSIIGCEDCAVTLEVSADLGQYVPSIEFTAEAWRLLNALIERLDKMQKNPSEIVKALVCDGRKSIDYSNCGITTGQDNAVRMSQTQPITFVWGPPGTGKTETLAKIALTHIRQGHRVLMLSYSNVSVDGAIMRVYKLARDSEPGVLVRYGYPKSKDVLEHGYLSTYNLAIHNHTELLKGKEQLTAERKTLSRTSQRYVQIGRRLIEIKDILFKEEKDAVQSAKFVATTVSKAIVDSAVRRSSFDVVIFDEASMAYIPQIVYSASLAQKHFICMGDFRQLPPIVQSSGSSPLRADIFRYCGITAAVDTGKNHKWLCMLDTQYRMHPGIADFASRAMYGGLLRSADGMGKARRDIVSAKPIAGHALAFADLSGMMSACVKTATNSRVNVLGAFVAFSLALEAAETYETGIITPYHAQSRLLRAMVKDAMDKNPALKPIACATVHQFQGSERDVIVYDAVDCYSMPYPGMLLTSMENNYANRLFNVALTRSRGKFICVANIAYMENKNLSSALAFAQMIAAQRGKASCLHGSALMQKRLSIEGSGMSFWDEMGGSQQFLHDISTAHREIRIDMPDKPEGNVFLKTLAAALQVAKTKGIKVYLRAENKDNLPDALKPFAIENVYAANPVAVIDKSVVWFGMPRSEAVFKSAGRSIETRYRPVIRFEGARTATALYTFMEMGKTANQSET